MTGKLIESLNTLSDKVRSQREAIQTEEATKNAFVMPFLHNVLGYDVFDPNEVVPEFTADVGLKRGEKVDYAIKHSGIVQILIEVKKSSLTLALEHASQLYRYFAVTNARIAILTNGQIWQFYTDLDAPNRMDSKPFLVLDLLDLDPVVVPELAKLTRENFDLDSVIGAAEELKYLGQIKREIAAQFREPSDEWVKFFTTKCYEGRFTQKVLDQFTPLVLKASTQFLNDQTSNKLRSALGVTALDQSEVQTGDVAPLPVEQVASEPISDVDITDVVTTDEELAGFAIVKAIACAVVKPNRIVARDAKSYFAVLLDDNNRKSVARLWFNARAKKYLSLFDEAGNESKLPINEVEDIYEYADQIRSRVSTLASGVVSAPSNTASVPPTTVDSATPTTLGEDDTVDENRFLG
jgi:hypothetical protein